MGIKKLDKPNPKNWNAMSDPSGFLTPSQVGNIIKNADNNTLKMLFNTSYRTGGRISSILKMKGEDLKEAKARTLYLNVEKKKTNYKKYKAANSKLIKALIKFCLEKDVREKDFIFRVPGTKKPYTRQLALYYFVKAAERAGITQVGIKAPHIHHLRHSFARFMAQKLKSPADLIMLKDMMDHSSTKVTEIYLQFRQRDISQMLDDAFDGGNK